MYLYKKTILMLILAAGLLSCRKYVENVPVQGQRVLVYTDDYRLLMNTRSSTASHDIASGLATVLSCDDIDLSAPQLQSPLLLNRVNTAMYTWQKPFQLEQVNDNDWNSMYATMFVYNTVIEGVMGSAGGSMAMKNTIMAEALTHRAFNYFTLVNLYGKQYDPATSSTDLGVPILLEAKLFVDLTRPSVSKVYEQILLDIRKAIPLLPLTRSTALQPYKGSAYALLSKVYLNMRDFENAKKFADSSLAITGELLDYNTVVTSTGNTFPSQFVDKQVLLRRIAWTTYNTLQLSQGLLDLLPANDLRYVLFVRPGTSFNPAYSGSGYWPRERYSGGVDKPAVGLTVNETWLIKAECLAREGKRGDALKMLNDLRKLRFRPADYVALSATSDEDILQLIVNERRREFFGTGLRWFDQRRLNKDPMFAKTVIRILDGTTYKLEPNSNSYVFPLSSLILKQNPELLQNPN